ncbi:MAG TPA: hypothetical protein VFW11_13275 [Cyclobacteriaceae bacterium]|nr:hypothetical protein [Cyclobacteriaceae bacterium]
MKKLVLFVFASLMAFGCKQNQQPVEQVNTKENDSKAMYEKNLSTLRASISAFEREDLDSWSSYVADNMVFSPAAYGSKQGSKEDWRKELAFFNSDWDSIKLTHPNFLPGIDSVSHEFDGSVRYYGTWTAVHKSGVKTAANFYGTYEFNAENKIISAAHFFDIGGLMNAVAAKK